MKAEQESNTATNKLCEAKCFAGDKNFNLFQEIKDLCHGEPDCFLRGFETQKRTLIFYFAIIVLGAGIYGFTIGLWRAPLQAIFTAIKFPALIIITTVLNALLNGMIAQLIGLRISFRQSFLAITASFAIASLILASLSPITFFVLLNTPEFGSSAAKLAHSFIYFLHISIIAFAGIMGNIALFRLLMRICGKKTIAMKVLFVWLLGNMFLGCQLSWIMRPFMGTPEYPVVFLRPEAFDGNFYESIWRVIKALIAG